MKNNMLFASLTAIINAAAINLCDLLFSSTPESLKVASNLSQLITPFLALLLIRLYTKIDHPPALLRQEAAIAVAIKICRKHLKDKDAPEEFKKQTREQLSELMLKQQKLRVDFESTNSYESSLESRDTSQTER
ncbi:hypothetical protein [Pseudomonas citri]|uniref:hypothetical protein n=1 Tax=Pseudomonas citri TaxID=2978349 RepID=UPI0021B58786|nr:hypothetical protein [Pseudomonas citri]